MIRQASQNDLCRLAEIHIDGWRYAYKGIATDYELFVERQVIHSIKMFESILINNPETISLFEDDNKIIKGFALHSKNRGNFGESIYEITALYIQPEFINQGIGTQLVKNIIENVNKNIFSEIIVWTLEKNLKAIQFYQKCTFQIDTNKKFDESWKEWEIRLTKKLK